MEQKLDLALDKLGPSIAMLPSADAAMVAFAEVTSFVRFFAETSPPDALPKLLVALRTAKTADDALKEVSGETLAQWDVKWRAHLAQASEGAALADVRPRRERRRASATRASGRASPSSSSGASHPAEALIELDKIPADMLADPSLRYLRARVLEGADNAKQAETLVEDPKLWMASYGPCWAIRGRLARARGDESPRRTAPLPRPWPTIRSASRRPARPCRTVPPARRSAAQGAPLCEAARKRGDPDLGRE